MRSASLPQIGVEIADCEHCAGDDPREGGLCAADLRDDDRGIDVPTTVMASIDTNMLSISPASARRFWRLVSGENPARGAPAGVAGMSGAVIRGGDRRGAETEAFWPCLSARIC